jgi:hypothetical protein
MSLIEAGDTDGMVTVRETPANGPAAAIPDDERGPAVPTREQPTPEAAPPRPAGSPAPPAELVYTYEVFEDLRMQSEAAMQEQLAALEEQAVREALAQADRDNPVPSENDPDYPELTAIERALALSNRRLARMEARENAREQANAEARKVLSGARKLLDDGRRLMSRYPSLPAKELNKVFDFIADPGNNPVTTDRAFAEIAEHVIGVDNLERHRLPPRASANAPRPGTDGSRIVTEMSLGGGAAPASPDVGDSSPRGMRATIAAAAHQIVRVGP